jgi:DNA-binding protein HU-beta
MEGLACFEHTKKEFYAKMTWAEQLRTKVSVYILKISSLEYKDEFKFIYLQAKKNLVKLIEKMTKAEIVSKISDKLGIEKGDVQATVESFMEEVKSSLENGDNVYLRGFGSFIVKTRAEKTGRNISKNTTIKIPAHNIPAFKPAKVFVEGVKSNVLVK